MASNVATADSAASSSSAVKSEISAAIVEELMSLEAALGSSAAASIARARERLLARVAQADSSSSRQKGGEDWSWGGDNVQALHAQADRLVSINRCIRFYIESVFASECSHGARVVRMRELRSQSMAALGSGQAGKVGCGDDSTWTTQGDTTIFF
jgi:hypothetical protein